MRIVVVGGNAAGASAAAKARRTNEQASIVLFERGQYVSFANCGLPYYVGGEIENVDNLLVVQPSLLRQRYRIDVKTGHEVTRIDLAQKQVAATDLATGNQFMEPFDRLILSTGGRPTRPPFPGINLRGVLTLTTIPEAQMVKTMLQETAEEDVVVIGGGFIGLEAVDALLNLGRRVHLIEKLDQVLPPVDRHIATAIADHLRQRGVQLHLGAEVAGFKGDAILEGVLLGDSTEIPTHVAIIGIGVTPDLTLARQAGLEIGAAGGIVVDDHMRTSKLDVFACGDIVESVHLITRKAVRIPLAGPANKQGRIAGANAAGGDMAYRGVLGSMVVKVGALTVAKSGLSEREARLLGIDCFSSLTYGDSHASYYPGSKSMTMKLLVEKPGGRVIGAQIIGEDGVDKRIDVLATAMYAGLDVEDLESLDLAYAPPYSSAKDPVIMAGFVAANISRHEVRTLTSEQLAKLLVDSTDVQLLDVRTPREFNRGHIEGAVLVPVDELRSRYTELDQARLTAIYCKAGARSYLAYKILQANGFEDVYNLSGGYDAWRFSQGDLS
ncbi:MAG: FAD-dependent oxidoreductase [Dehalococcoidia bacterium]|nr:FAD-dependent oxidoreductase [Dehalococcoidia bacterium]